jgi:parallel beta-helix repeat protein
VYGIWGDIVNDIRVIGNDMQEGRGTNGVDSIPASTNAIYFNRCGVRSLINSNKINAWYGVGIELGAFSAEPNPEIVISGNHISETEGGIKVSEDGGTLIVGNMITNDRNDRQDNTAIQCVADNVSIKSNHIVLFGKGIVSQAADITITGNDIYDCGRGIDLAGATENKVTANNVVDRRGSPSMDYGVIERASADDNEIFLNSFVNAQTSAALITGTGTRYGLNRNYDYERFTDTGYTVQHNENGDLYQQTSTVSTSGDNDIFSFFAGATDANISQRFRVTNGDDSVTNMRLRAEPGATASDSYFEIDANARVSGTARIDGVETTLSGIIRKTTRITQANSPYTMTSANHVLVCDTDGGAITVYLPVGVEGTEYTIKNVGSSGNAVTIDPDGAETIFGASSELVYDGEVFDIVFDSTEGWR